MTRSPSSPDIVELLERADEYLGTISNKGNCGPHHLVSDLAAALRSTDAAATPTASTELRQHDDEFFRLIRSLLTDVAIAKLGVTSSRANDMLHKLKHLKELRDAAQPPAKSLCDYTDAEIATEHGWRMQRALGDPRVCVGMPMSSTEGK